MKTYRTIVLIFACLLLLTGCSDPPPRPPVPVVVARRPSLVGKGYVWIVTNTSDRDLTFQIRIEFGPTWHPTVKKIATLDIKAGKERSLGWAELKFEVNKGDRLYISHLDYETSYWSIPEWL